MIPANKPVRSTPRRERPLNQARKPPTVTGSAR
jgi:hypothetical protein